MLIWKTQLKLGSSGSQQLLAPFFLLWEVCSNVLTIIYSPCGNVEARLTGFQFWISSEVYFSLLPVSQVSLVQTTLTCTIGLLISPIWLAQPHFYSEVSVVSICGKQRIADWECFQKSMLRVKNKTSSMPSQNLKNNLDVVNQPPGRTSGYVFM